MMYLGGKSKMARQIAETIAPRGFWWEPFCGGLSVSVELAKYGPGSVTDACSPLIELYAAVAKGWDPPSALSREQYEAARHLPDTDPLKAFAGFGCSFAAKWFDGYDGERSTRSYRKQGRAPEVMTVDKPAACRAALLRDVPRLSECSLECVNFFDVNPLGTNVFECIYADPPYAGTTGYKATGRFDRARFWAYCQAWAARGVRVFVSELSCPVAAEVVLEKAHRQDMWRDGQKPLRAEKLFRVSGAPHVTIRTLKQGQLGMAFGEVSQ